MTRTIRAAATAVLSAALLAGCSNPTEQEDPLASGVLRVGTENTYAPYAYVDESGELVGMEVEIITLLAQDLGLKPEFTATEWDGLIAGVDANKYDVVIDGLAATPERAAKYDFTDQYTVALGRYAVTPDSPLQTIDDVTGKKVAVSPTSNWGQIVRDAGHEIVASDGLVQSLQLLHTGRADTTLNDVVSFAMYNREQPDTAVRLLDGAVEAPDCCSVLVKRGNEELVRKLNDAIAARIADGSINAITQKYAGVDLAPKR